jgi:glycerol-3-phosphate acyltransferase PlsX
MGGDQGPHITISAAISAVLSQPNLYLVLCGNSTIISQELTNQKFQNHPQLSIVHCNDVVEMHDKPSVALRSKKNSSMRVVLDLVQQGKAQACVSGGNTGALFSMANFVLKTLPGVERPALISSLPTHDENKRVFMLDLGANVFCEADVLYQFGLMGSVMAEQVDNIKKPRVALLNMGSEEMKGSDHIKLAATKLQANEEINYIGFIEGNDIFTNKADVIVCDGFVGNIALKTCEGVARLVLDKLKVQMSQHKVLSVMSKLLSSIIKKCIKPMNPDQYNGASLIGLRGIVVKSHGNASSDAFFIAIIEAVKEIERQVPDKIKAKLEQGLLQRP